MHTAQYASSLDLDDFSLSVVTPLPGTPLYDECIERKILNSSFDCDDIRYSVSAIKIDDMTEKEIENLRYKTWREFQEKKKVLQKEKKTNCFNKFNTSEEFSLAGFKSPASHPVSSANKAARS